MYISWFSLFLYKKRNKIVNATFYLTIITLLYLFSLYIVYRFFLRILDLHIKIISFVSEFCVYILQLIFFGFGHRIKNGNCTFISQFRFLPSQFLNMFKVATTFLNLTKVWVYISVCDVWKKETRFLDFWSFKDTNEKQKSLFAVV